MIGTFGWIDCRVLLFLHIENYVCEANSKMGDFLRNSSFMPQMKTESSFSSQVGMFHQSGCQFHIICISNIG